jgi:signal peptidase I
MKSVLVALSGLVAPGFAHGLMGHRRTMWIALASAYLAAAAIALSVWFAWLVLAIVVASIVHAGLLHRRLGANVRYGWLDPVLAFASVVVLNVLLRMFVIEAFKSPSSSMSPTLALGDHFFINKLASVGRGDIVVFGHPCQPDRDWVKRVIAIGGDTVEVRCSVVHVNGAPLARELVEDGATCTYEDRFEDHTGGGEWVTRPCSRYRETVDGTTFEVFQEPDQPERDRAGTRDRPDPKDFPTEVVPRSCDGIGGASTAAPGKIVVTDNAPTNHCKPSMHLVVPPDSLFVLGDNRANSNDSRYWGVVPQSHVKGRVFGRWLPLSRFGGLR